MANGIRRRQQDNRAAIYARVSDRSQAEDDKTSIQEQVADMEAYCARKGLVVAARYQEVGKGWSKKRPEFQHMLADAREDDRHHRLLEVGPAQPRHVPRRGLDGGRGGIKSALNRSWTPST